MGKKLSRVYEALIQGVGEGLYGHDLYAHIVSGCPASSDKRICRASILAMEDGRIVDRTRLEVIYSIAVDHCMRSRGKTRRVNIEIR